MREPLVVAVLILSIFLAAAQAVPVAAAGETPVRELKLGFIYPSPVGDAGWTYAHDLARVRLADEPGIKTYFMERVPEVGPHAERAIRTMSRKGYDIIVSTSLGFMDSTLKVAAEFPGITYLHCSGYHTTPNVSAFFGRMYEARYLTGLVAGRMSTSKRIGFVAAFPVPEVFRGINAFTLGVREANPEAEVRVLWSNSWYNPTLENALARELIAWGADVLAQHQDSSATQEAAQDSGVYSVGYNFDMSSFAPDAHLVAAVWDWLPFYEDVVAKVRAGTWKSGLFWPGMDSGIVDISAFGPMVPEEVRNTVLARRQEILDGTRTVFRGPLHDREGALRVREGEEPGLRELQDMRWFVPGVVGEAR